MLFFGIIIIILFLFLLIRYEPKLDLVISYNKHILLLWYNKIEGKYVTRTYIKICEL